MRDPERTLLLPVALAEELPARETAELVARVRQQVGVALDRVVVNAVAARAVPARAARPRRGASRALPATPAPGRRPHVLATCAAHLRVCVTS